MEQHFQLIPKIIRDGQMLAFRFWCGVGFYVFWMPAMPVFLLNVTLYGELRNFLTPPQLLTQWCRKGAKGSIQAKLDSESLSLCGARNIVFCYDHRSAGRFRSAKKWLILYRTIPCNGFHYICHKWWCTNDSKLYIMVVSSLRRASLVSTPAGVTCYFNPGVNSRSRVFLFVSSCHLMYISNDIGTFYFYFIIYL